MDTVWNSLDNCTKLKNVTFSHDCMFTLSDELFLTLIPKALSNCLQLRVLQLDLKLSNNIEKELIQLLKSLCSLETLALATSASGFTDALAGIFVLLCW